MMQYAIGVLLLLSTEFIPVIGEILEGMRDAPFPVLGNISQIIDTTIWSFGLICGYMIMNMIDVNYYSANEACTGKIGAVRIIISIIAFAAAFYYQFHGQLMSIVSNII
jgi:hypothetical protein